MLDKVIAGRVNHDEAPSVSRVHRKAALGRLFQLRRWAILAYSGGVDSSALLRLCRPYRGPFTVLWAADSEA